MTTQVKNLHDVGALREYVAELGVEIPIADSVESDGALAQPITIGGRHATPTMTAPNRFAILPMEGWDCETDGNPTDLVRRRWSRFGSSGAGLVWGEATAVQLDGRANPNQLVIRPDTIDGIAELRGLLHPDQVAGLRSPTRAAGPDPSRRRRASAIAIPTSTTRSAPPTTTC